MNLSRREAIVRLAVFLGASVVGPRLLADRIGRSDAGAAGYSDADLALLDEIGETIIPATPGAPGAKAVGIGAFIVMMVADCYYPAEQAAFKAGLGQLAADFAARHGGSFSDSPAAARTAFLNELDREQKAHTAALRRRSRQARGEAGTEEKDDPARPVPHYFRMMKDLTLLGYFTSEFASTQLLGWVEVPGHYDGNVPYVKKTLAPAPA